jgi:hypothetical protein
MLVGPIYRLRVMNIPFAEGVEVFPTVEVVDRVYAPPGEELRFPIPVELTAEELRMAAAGKFVTRVIYIEDPHAAVPVAQDESHQSWFDVGPGKSPLAVARNLGRPVAILRMGGRLPKDDDDNMQFLCGCPPLMHLESYEIPTQAPIEQPQPEQGLQSPQWSDSRIATRPAQPTVEPQQTPVSQKPFVIGPVLNGPTPPGKSLIGPTVHPERNGVKKLSPPPMPENSNIW